MRTVRVQFRGTRQEARAAIHNMYHNFVHGTEMTSEKRRLGANVASQFFTLVSQSFHNLSTSGQDDNVGTWNPLDARTLAYSRGSVNERRGGGYGVNNMKGSKLRPPGIAGRGELSSKQINTWAGRYFANLKELLHQHGITDARKMIKEQKQERMELARKAFRFARKAERQDDFQARRKYIKRAMRVRSELHEIRAFTAQEGGDVPAQVKSQAAARAYISMQQEGYLTKLETLGQRAHKILVESGELQRSLATTAQPSTELQNYQPAGEQLYELKAAAITCGSKLARAHAHHHGLGDAYAPITEIGGSDRRGRYTQSGAKFQTGIRKPRRLWPETLSSDWMERIKNAVALSVEGAVMDLSSGDAKS